VLSRILSFGPDLDMLSSPWPVIFNITNYAKYWPESLGQRRLLKTPIKTGETFYHQHISKMCLEDAETFKYFNMALDQKL
jgi:hypothetical protein